MNIGIIFLWVCILILSIFIGLLIGLERQPRYYSESGCWLVSALVLTDIVMIISAMIERG